MKTARVKESQVGQRKQNGKGARVSDRNHRLREWLDTCDPELSVLCILIAQTMFTRGPGYSGLDRVFEEKRGRLIERAKLGRLQELWERRDWEALERRIQIRGISPPEDPQMPLERGLP